MKGGELSLFGLKGRLDHGNVAWDNGDAWRRDELRGRPTNLPHDAHVAILLRGQIHRVSHAIHGKSSHCRPEAEELQRLATASIAKHVLRPLLARNNSLRLVLTNSPCALTGRVVGWLSGAAPTAKLVFASVETGGQADSVRATMDLFSSGYGGASAAGEATSLVLILRHDTLFLQPIDEWPTDWEKIVVASPCNAGASQGPTCVNDILHAMPGARFPAFAGAVADGHSTCFGPGPNHNGHRCRATLERVVGPISFASDWVPLRSVREPNPFAFPVALAAERRRDNVSSLSVFAAEIPSIARLWGGVRADDV